MASKFPSSQPACLTEDRWRSRCRLGGEHQASCGISCRALTDMKGDGWGLQVILAAIPLENTNTSIWTFANKMGVSGVQQHEHAEYGTLMGGLEAVVPQSTSDTLFNSFHYPPKSKKDFWLHGSCLILLSVLFLQPLFQPASVDTSGLKLWMYGKAVWSWETAKVTSHNFMCKIKLYHQQATATRSKHWTDLLESNIILQYFLFLDLPHWDPF